MAKILAFAGSARKDSFNKKLVRVAAAAAEAAGGEITLIDLADYPMPLFSQDLEAEQGMPASARQFKQLLSAHDGVLIASPEYNSAFSPLLKNVIDWASRAESEDEPALSAYRGKVAAIISASPGGLGGLRGLVFLRMLLGNIGVMVLPQQLAVGNAMNAFDADGALTDPRQRASVEAIASALVATVDRLQQKG